MFSFPFYLLDEDDVMENAMDEHARKDEDRRLVKEEKQILQARKRKLQKKLRIARAKAKLKMLFKLICKEHRRKNLVASSMDGFIKDFGRDQEAKLAQLTAQMPRKRFDDFEELDERTFECRSVEGGNLFFPLFSTLLH